MVIGISVLHGLVTLLKHMVRQIYSTEASSKEEKLSKIKYSTGSASICYSAVPYRIQDQVV